MKIALVQWSDIHLQSAASDNPILKRSQLLLGALRSATSQADVVIIAISGDIAFSGHTAQYELAIEFLDATVIALTRELTPKRAFLAIVPGNHDCDFSREDATRSILLQGIDLESLYDDGPLENCLGVQRNYAAFAASLGTRFPGVDIIALAGWWDRKTAQIAEGVSVDFQLLNSAWASQKSERQGALGFPLALLRDRFQPNDSADVVISILHHPFGWYRADNARALRKLLEQSSDVILTGHEHESEFYRKEASNALRNEYVEGAVLQDSSDPRRSAFNVATIDIHNYSYAVTSYSLDLSGSQYVRSQECETARSFGRNRARLKGRFPFTDEFDTWLSDPGVVFTHPTKKSLLIEDLFVWPDFREIGRDDTIEAAAIIQGETLADQLERHERVVIFGPEASGKTTLAKQIARELYRRGVVPVVVDSDRIARLSPGRERAVVDDAIRFAYGTDQQERFWQLPASQRAIIVDDYQRVAIAPIKRDQLLQYLIDQFGKVVLLATDEVRLEEFTKRSADTVSLWDFKHLECLEFGFARRSHLIRKWHGLSTECGTEAEIQRALAEVESKITSIIGEQIVPAFPLFILVMLQQLELPERVDWGGGSIGYLYDALVLRSLMNSVTRDADIESNKNYLSELAYKLFADGSPRISRTDATLWHSEYCHVYKVALDFDGQRESLTRAGLIHAEDGAISFRYPYLYYYFVGQYIAAHISDDSVKAHVRVLTQYLHQIDSANIILFLCHFSRDPFILRAVCETADGLFARYEECALDADVKEIAFPAIEVQCVELSDGDPESHRQQLLREADERAMRCRQTNGGDSSRGTEAEVALAELNEQLQMNAALKTIQIIGQILRNHFGSLRGEVKEGLVRTSIGLGLRAMKCLLGVYRDNLGEMVDVLVAALERKRGGVPRQKLLEDVNRSLWSIAELGVVAIIKYVSDSVGSERLAPTFNEALSPSESSAIATIDLSIRLDHYVGFPEKQTIDLAKRFAKNPFGFAVLRDLVWMRFYLYHTDYKTKQRICEKLKISQKGRRKLLDQRTKKGHGKSR